MERTVTCSPDRRGMTIRTGDGQLVTMRSARPHGFTDADIELAHTIELKDGMIPGQVDRARCVRIGGRAFLLQLNTGPPTWWWPRVTLRRDDVMVGWLRGLVAVSWYTDSGITP